MMSGRVKWFEGMLLSWLSLAVAGFGAETNNPKLMLASLIPLVISLIHLMIFMPHKLRILGLLVLGWAVSIFLPVYAIAGFSTLVLAYIVLILFKKAFS